MGVHASSQNLKLHQIVSGAIFYVSELFVKVRLSWRLMADVICQLEKVNNNFFWPLWVDSFSAFDPPDFLGAEVSHSPVLGDEVQFGA